MRVKKTFPSRRVLCSLLLQLIHDITRCSSKCQKKQEHLSKEKRNHTKAGTATSKNTTAHKKLGWVQEGEDTKEVTKESEDYEEGIGELSAD